MGILKSLLGLIIEDQLNLQVSFFPPPLKFEK